jgi:hypothetical protein
MTDLTTRSRSNLTPGRNPALVFDFDQAMATGAGLAADSEAPAGQPGIAVEHGISRQLGYAQQDVVCDRAAVE